MNRRDQRIGARHAGSKASMCWCDASRIDSAFHTAEECPNLISSHSVGGTTMRFRVRKTAHVLERIGLAMAGAACGLFVAAHVGSSIAVFTSQGFIVVMMIVGAIGFYLGIDTPPLPFELSEGRVDTAEFLTAVGTFLATWTAFVSVSVIVFRQEPHIFWTIMVMLGWVVGVTMQITAGAIARLRT